MKDNAEKLSKRELSLSEMVKILDRENTILRKDKIKLEKKIDNYQDVREFWNLDLYEKKVIQLTGENRKLKSIIESQGIAI